MTYIWNRAERVPKDKMPHVVEDSFKEWENELFKNFDQLNDAEKFRVRNKYSTQLRKKNVALMCLGYK
jgi:hypothetical protein